ncbi:MAG: gliding motility-associated C-terminal domain-containing protein [Saprospiraceae bacterium]
MNNFRITSQVKHSKDTILWLLFIVFAVTSSVDVQSQCSTSTPLDIPDDGCITIQFIVSGLTDNDLASPTQGICGVNLDFMHEYLGDVSVTLISPSGTSVTLIGPVTTAITPTNLSRFNIKFVPCMTAAAPDAGFSPEWSNIQPWQAFTPYSGSYHPYIGCLEDFNSGPANGVWQIIICDNDVLETGTLASDLLIFCNPAGLQCSQCNPKGGTLSPTIITKCVGQNISSAEITTDFGGNPPDPAAYSYEYVMTNGNTIVRYGSFFSDTPPPGNYTICGLSYLTIDSTQVNTLFAAGNYSQLVQEVSTGIICGEFSSPCVSLHVLSVPDTTDISVNLCNGESYSFGGQSYSLMGSYYQTHDGPGLCDSVFHIQVFTSGLDFNFILPDSLNCGSGNVIINSTISGNVGPVTYSWSTLTGNIIGPINTSSITVDQPGQYFLSIADAICSKVKVISILADQGFPQVFVEGGQITCTNPSVTIDPIFIPTSASIQWTGPMGFSSSQPIINVTVPGVYLLTVTNQSGCATTRPVTVTIDTAVQNFNIISFGKDCQNGFIMLGSDNDNSVVGWKWTGPNGFFTNYWRPDISFPGTYTLTSTFLNGCQRSASYFFDGDFSLPDINVSTTDTLNCNEIISLSVSSVTPSVSYSWNGPNGFSSGSSLIQVTQTGNYTAHVSAPNGCSAMDDVVIALGSDIFNYQTFTDTINCANDTAVIGVVSAAADLYKWIGFPGPDSLNSSIHVGSAGLYTVMMTDTSSGCVVMADINVITDRTPPSFSYIVDTITCNHSIAQLSFVPSGGIVYSNIFWELPDQSIVPSPTIMSSLPGEHLLYGIGANGCTSIAHVRIPFDTISPSLFIETSPLGCDDTVDIVTLAVAPISGYQWSGPGIVTPGIQQIAVNKPGIYDLIVTALNGCTTTYNILVDSNFSVPIYNLTFDSLRCDVPAILEVSSNDTLDKYTWLNSAGTILSTDSIASANFPGLYSIEIRAANNCFVLDTITIEPAKFPVFSFETDTLTCKDKVVTIKGIPASAPVTFQWSDINGNPLGVTDQIMVSNIGPYILSVTGQNACETLDTILVPIDTIPPVANLKLLGEVRCQNRDIMFDGSSSTPQNIQLNWSTIGGIILGNNSLPVIQAKDTGIYILKVIRNDNGCEDLDSFHLTENPEAITQAILEISQPECSGDSNASIHILTLHGGIQPLLYQLDGGVLQSADIFNDLKPGDHLLQILDAAGCLYDTLVTIIPTDPFNVNAGPDQEIYLGESTSLSGTNDLLPAQLLNESWDSLGVFICTDCPDFEVSPHETSAYRYQVVSATGCVLEDEVIIYVIEKGKYFIANVFSPNGDGINDEVRLYTSPGIIKVLQWVIFDRWGNAVFGRTDMDPMDPSLQWDGYTPRGERLNPAVFPYLLEVELLNGKTELYHGTITLLR